MENRDSAPARRRSRSIEWLESYPESLNGECPIDLLARGDKARVQALLEYLARGA